MEHRFPGGRRPRTVHEWKAYVDGLSRYELDQLYPGKLRDLIPAAEMIDAMERAEKVQSGFGMKGRQSGLGKSDQADGRNVTSEVRSYVSAAASALRRKVPELQNLASKVASGAVLSADENALVNLLRQTRVKGASAIRQIANTCDQAARALEKPGLRFVRSDNCYGQHVNACADTGGYEVRLTRQFFKLGSARKVSVIGHEGVHLAGYKGEAGPRGAEAVEAVTFRGHSQAYPSLGNNQRGLQLLSAFSSIGVLGLSGGAMQYQGINRSRKNRLARSPVTLGVVIAGVMLSSCAPSRQSKGTSVNQLPVRSHHYEAVVTMELQTEDPWLGHPDHPGFLPLFIDMRNTAEKAICLPLALVPFPKEYVNEVFQVWETETGEETPRVATGFVTDSDDLHNNVNIIPPGQSTWYVAILSSGFELTPGKEYRVLYDVEGYFCDAFNTGYPHTDEAYSLQESSTWSFFDRSPATVVKFRAELVFEAL